MSPADLLAHRLMLCRWPDGYRCPVCGCDTPLVAANISRNQTRIEVTCLRCGSGGNLYRNQLLRSLVCADIVNTVSLVCVVYHLPIDQIVDTGNRGACLARHVLLRELLQTMDRKTIDSVLQMRVDVGHQLRHVPKPRVVELWQAALEKRSHGKGKS